MTPANVGILQDTLLWLKQAGQARLFACSLEGLAISRGFSCNTAMLKQSCMLARFRREYL